MIRIVFNNKPTELESDTSLQEFIDKNGMIPTNIAIAVNNSVVPKEKWENTIINDGDTLLIIKAYYGG
jgi:sulfur carrier protein